MRLSENKLRRIVKEEIHRVLNEDEEWGGTDNRRGPGYPAGVGETEDVPFLQSDAFQAISGVFSSELHELSNKLYSADSDDYVLSASEIERRKNSLLPLAKDLYKKAERANSKLRGIEGEHVREVSRMVNNVVKSTKNFINALKTGRNLKKAAKGIRGAQREYEVETSQDRYVH